MNLTFFGASLVSFLGIYCGVALSYIAPEELQMGKKYFNWFYKLLVFGLGFVLLKNLWISILIGIIFVFLFKIETKGYYHILSLMLIVSAFMGTFYLSSGIVFLIGLVVSTYYCIQFEKDEELPVSKMEMIKKVTKEYSLFLVFLIIFLIV